MEIEKGFIGVSSTHKVPVLAINISCRFPFRADRNVDRDCNINNSKSKNKKPTVIRIIRY